MNIGLKHYSVHNVDFLIILISLKILIIIKFIKTSFIVPIVINVTLLFLI